MGEFIDKTKGMANEAIGKVKQEVGRENNDDYVKSEGAKQEIKGDAQQVKGAVKGALGDNI